MSIVFIPFLLMLVIGISRFFMGSVRTKAPVSDERAAFQRRIRLIGVGTLVAGMLIAASIYMKASLDEQADPTANTPQREFQHTFAPAETKKSDLAMESIAGKEGVLGTEITEWFESLGHGKRLAYTVAVISLAGFLTCLFIAHPHLAEAKPAEKA
jgi:hypothetical protein